MSENKPGSEEEFEVVDRRRAAKGEQEEPADPGDAEAAAQAAKEAAEELPPELLEVLAPSSVESVLHGAIGNLGRLAWEHMGLVASARTGEIATDFAGARRAIDAAEEIAKLLRPSMPPEGVRNLDTLLSDLKVNLVKQEQKASS
jgi:hypothetical protein